jgi:hypothetical protein
MGILALKLGKIIDFQPKKKRIKYLSILDAFL